MSQSIFSVKPWEITSGSLSATVVAVTSVSFLVMFVVIVFIIYNRRSVSPRALIYQTVRFIFLRCQTKWWGCNVSNFPVALKPHGALVLWCATCKGQFLSRDSLGKNVSLAKIPWPVLKKISVAYLGQKNSANPLGRNTNPPGQIVYSCIPPGRIAAFSVWSLFLAANLALAGFPLTNALGESTPSRY